MVNLLCHHNLRCRKLQDVDERMECANTFFGVHPKGMMLTGLRFVRDSTYPLATRTKYAPTGVSVSILKQTPSSDLIV